ncbi:MAG TPA: lytic transglycosylase domain-containing protein [Bryobacteraceae bacterium]|jgi:soluble lytic murein transglycosylase-like protein
MALIKLLITLVLLTTVSTAAVSPAAAPTSNTVDAAWISAQQAIQQQLTSLDKQRQSIHQQLGEPVDSTGIRVADFIDPWTALPQAPCPALDHDEVNALVAEAARKQALPPELLHAVMKQESAFKPCAVSMRGAQGLMQLMPTTAQQFHVVDPFDPAQNVLAGAAFLKQLLTRYKGDLRLALAAYNAGPLRADQEGNRAFPIETQNYLANIFADLGVDQSLHVNAEVSEAADQPIALDNAGPVSQTADRIETPVKPPKP